MTSKGSSTNGASNNKGSHQYHNGVTNTTTTTTPDPILNSDGSEVNRRYQLNLYETINGAEDEGSIDSAEDTSTVHRSVRQGLLRRFGADEEGTLTAPAMTGELPPIPEDEEEIPNELPGERIEDDDPNEVPDSDEDEPGPPEA